ncbi:MAG: hypothetical protein HC839_05570 [Leptolyngbyaceae cyanobacterium RM2_2_21]|nr:hypothetical protein [Leptolyngbyaceae cyanobacterium RM2_2_21]NJN03228.1 hypothetical protein [Leptolyngbyaceae cyanobacterium RM1_1_2]
MLDLLWDISWLVSLAGVFCLMAVHLHAVNIRSLSHFPRSWWLSFASGVSVAYVFIHLLPDLNQHQSVLAEAIPLAFVESHVYIMALLGLAVFYGLERLVKRSQQRSPHKTDETPSLQVYWLHIAAFAVYNALIGYLLLHREDDSFKGLLFFIIAMSLHFLVNDVGLQQDHKRTYHGSGRWILAATVLVGWVVGNSTEISEAAIAVLFAFLAGGIILNVLKEELPEERESQFWAFATGATFYSALLLAL